MKHKCKVCDGENDLKIEVISGHLICYKCRDKMLKSLKKMEAKDEVSEK